LPKFVGNYIYNSGQFVFGDAIDQQMFVIDPNTHRMGIGTLSPANYISIANTKQLGFESAVAGTDDVGLLRSATQTLKVTDGSTGFGSLAALGLTSTNLTVDTNSLFVDSANHRVGIGTTTPGQKLTVEGTFGILEGGTSPTYHTIFQGGDQSADITYTLPTAQGGTNTVLTNNGSGILSWTNAGTSGTSGTSGSSGTSGTSGSNGSSGTSGTSGSNGSSGTSGTSGTANISALPGSNLTAIGPTMNALQAGASITIMDLVILNSSGQWVQTDANNISTYAGMVAIALESKTSGQAMSVALPNSVVRNDAWSWTPGAVLYMSETAGQITATQPTTSGAAIRVIGYALTATVIYFCPSPDYITHV
jgi:hypothetical protein